MTDIISAIQSRNLEAVKTAVSEGNEINKEYKRNNIPLFVAITYARNTDIIVFLLESGADVNSENFYGKTPLMKAVEHNKLEIVKILIQYGANVNAINGKTSPLQEAIEKKNFKIAELLIANGANVNHKDAQGTPPLYNSIYQQDYDLTKLLIEHGAGVNDNDNIRGETPLYWASVMRNNLGLVKLLIQNGADFNVVVRNTLLGSYNGQYANKSVLQIVLESENRKLKGIKDYFKKIMYKNYKHTFDTLNRGQFAELPGGLPYDINHVIASQATGYRGKPVYTHHVKSDFTGPFSFGKLSNKGLANDIIYLKSL